MSELGLLILLAVVLNIVVLVGFALFAPPADGPAERAPLWQGLLVWVTLCITLTSWLYPIVGLLGWMFVWGDNGPPSPRFELYVAGGLSLALATAVLARVALGWASTSYLKTLLWLSAGMWGAWVVLILASDGMLMRLMPLSPILIGLATWVGVYRRQLRERRLSLGSVFALMSVLGVGLAMTAYIRS